MIKVWSRTATKPVVLQFLSRRDGLSSYTFICLTGNQVATFVDPQPIGVEAIRAHAFKLLREHASAAVIEIWRDEQLVDEVVREGLRPARVVFGVGQGRGGEPV